MCDSIDGKGPEQANPRMESGFVVAVVGMGQGWGFYLGNRNVLGSAREGVQHGEYSKTH